MWAMSGLGLLAPMRLLQAGTGTFTLPGDHGAFACGELHGKHEAVTGGGIYHQRPVAVRINNEGKWVYDVMTMC